MKHVAWILVVATACSDGGGETTTDAGASGGDAAIDASIDAPADAPAIDAPPAEVCTGAGWCSSSIVPLEGWSLAVSPDGTPWVTDHGVYTRSGGAWRYQEVTWADLFDSFLLRNELYGVGAIAANDVWVAGAQGFTAHFDGATWQHHQQPSSFAFAAVVAAAPDNVWFLGTNGRRAQWNGSAIVAQPASTVEYGGAWGAGATDIYGFGETEIEDNRYAPAFDHFDGTTWTRTIVPGFGEVISLWAASATDIFAVVRLNGTTRVIRGAGATWTQVTDADVVQIYAVWGRSATDLWGVGQGGRIVHFDGTDWQPQASGVTATLTQVRGTAGIVWATGANVGLHHP